MTTGVLPVEYMLKLVNFFFLFFFFVNASRNALYVPPQSSVCPFDEACPCISRIRHTSSHPFPSVCLKALGAC